MGIFDKLFNNKPQPAKNKAAKPLSILDEYRNGLKYLDGCSTFGEAELREFNRITGNRFSEAEMRGQLDKAQLMLNGMEELKGIMRSTMVEAITAFEELERKGVDLSSLSQPSPSAQDDKLAAAAHVTIIRDSSAVAALMPTIITLNGQQVCSLKNGESAQIELTRRHNVLLTNSVGSKNVRYEFDVQDGAKGVLHVKGGVFQVKTARWL